MTSESTSLGSESRTSREEVQTFLYKEAKLLDEWHLDEWLNMFTDDAVYVVPTTDFPEGNPENSLVLIDDDKQKLYWRVQRLKSRHAWREYPCSRTRRLITNILIDEIVKNEIHVSASFIVNRFRRWEVANYIGSYKYVLVRHGDSFKIRYKRATLDNENLDQHGAVSIIL